MWYYHLTGAAQGRHSLAIATFDGVLELSAARPGRGRSGAPAQVAAMRFANLGHRGGAGVQSGSAAGRQARLADEGDGADTGVPQGSPCSQPCSLAPGVSSVIAARSLVITSNLLAFPED
jgi:hypothetical protein